MDHMPLKEPENNPTLRILEQQLELSQNAQTTATLLRFVLQLANNNLMSMREQLLEMRELAMEFDSDDGPGKAPN